MEWGHNGSHRPQKFRVQKSAVKVLASIFLESRRHPPHSLSSKSPNYQRGVPLCWCNWRTFWRKNGAAISPRRSCSCMTMPRLTGHLQPRRNWPTWASCVLITHPNLRIRPRRNTTCSLDWKKQLKDCHFSSDAEVIAAAETWLEGQHSEYFLSELYTHNFTTITSSYKYNNMDRHTVSSMMLTCSWLRYRLLIYHVYIACDYIYIKLKYRSIWFRKIKSLCRLLMCRAQKGVVHCSAPRSWFSTQQLSALSPSYKYEGWNFNSGNYLFTTDTK